MAETAFAKIEEEYNFSVKDLHNKRNRDKFERLAYAFAISPQDLANQLQDAGNIGEALKIQTTKKNFCSLPLTMMPLKQQRRQWQPFLLSTQAMER